MMNLKIAGCVIGFAVISLLPNIEKIESSINSYTVEESVSEPSEKSSKTKSAKKKKEDAKAAKADKAAIKDVLRDAIRECVNHTNETACTAAPAAPVADVPAVEFEDDHDEYAPAAVETEAVIERYYTVDESDGDDSTIAIVKVATSVPLKAKPECNARKIAAISRGETFKYITTHICEDREWYEVDFWGERAYLNADACDLYDITEVDYTLEYEYMCDLYGVR